MNILNILYNFCSGGVERLAIDVSNEYVKEGHCAHVCVISEKYDYKLIQQFSNDVHVHLLKKEKKNRKLHYLMQIINVIDDSKIDVVHVHQGTLMPFYFLLKLLRPNVRFYITIHDTYTYSELSYKNKFLCRVICRKLIAISNAVAEDIAKNGVARNKVVRVYNGVDFSRYPLVERKRTQNMIKIVNVARFYPPKKGQDILIKACALIVKRGYRIELVFAGGEITKEANEIDKMKTLACELGIADNISFLGDVRNVIDVLREGDIFCIPSRYEGFGISAVEAMGTGMPCVASNIIGLNEVVNSRSLGELFECGNEKDLADKLIYIIDHFTQYSPKQISEYVKSRYSIDHMVGELIKVYQE